MTTLRSVLKLLPWVLVVTTLLWTWMDRPFFFKKIEEDQKVFQTSLLAGVEKLGRLELAKYNFQEVTEIKKIGEVLDFRFFKYKIAPDAKAVLISQGSVTGCVDLTQIKSSDIYLQNDTLYVDLPNPEVCYFKIDLEKSRIYDLQIDYLSSDDKSAFIEELYGVAEKEIKESALQSGILEQTRENAKLILEPLFESLTEKKVLLRFNPNSKIVKSK